jgi:Domain of unknown function (DUF4386)
MDEAGHNLRRPVAYQRRMPDTIDSSQRRAAKVAAVATLLSMALVVYANFGVFAPLIVKGNAAETGRNILANERLFRTGIAFELLHSVGLVVLLAALYVIFRPVSRGMALLAALLRLVYAMAWILMTLRLFEVLRLLAAKGSLRAFQTDQLQALASLALRTARYDEYYVGLLFYAAASTLCAWLWLKSRYIPKLLAVFGVIASAFCVACTIAFVIEPGFANVVNLWWFDSPMALFEMATSVWLLVKGLPAHSPGERPEGRA